MAIDLAQYQIRLNEILKTSSQEIIDRAIVPAANNLLADIKNRIGLDGKDSDNNKLSGYSNKPAYFQKDDFVRKSSFRAVGQNGFKGERIVLSKKVKVKGQRKLERIYKVEKRAPKSMFIDDGYKGLRDIQGMDTTVKNLIYSGDMMLSYVMGKSDGEILLGFNNKEQSEKRKANEKREGKEIFKATDQEIKTYNEEFKKSYLDIIKQNVI